MVAKVLSALFLTSFKLGATRIYHELVIFAWKNVRPSTPHGK
jgi:hypothetical protein